MGIKNDRSIRLVINGADHQRIPIFCALHLYIRKHFQKTAFRTRKVKQKPEITEFCFIYETSRRLLSIPLEIERSSPHILSIRIINTGSGFTLLMYGCTHLFKCSQFARSGSAFLSCPSLIYTHKQVPQLRFATNLHICPSKHESQCANMHIRED